MMKRQSVPLAGWPVALMLCYVKFWRQNVVMAAITSPKGRVTLWAAPRPLAGGCRNFGQNSASELQLHQNLQRK